MVENTTRRLYKSFVNKEARKSSSSDNACRQALKLLLRSYSPLSLLEICDRLGIETGSKEYYRLYRFLKGLSKVGLLRSFRDRGALYFSVPHRSLEELVPGMLLREPSSLGVSLPELCRRLGIKKGSKEYYRLYRRLRSLERQGFLVSRRVDGVLYFKPTLRSVHLIQGPAKFKLREESAKGPGKSHGKVQTREGGRRKRGSGWKGPRIPSGRHKNPYRNLALLLASKLPLPLTLAGYKRLARHFLDYLADVSVRVIVLRHVDEDRLLGLPYKHRFRSLRRLMRSFREAWAILGADFDIAVFFTVTMEPRGTLLETAQLASVALNRLMSWLQKRLGFRPKYIAVFEFQANGAIHIHMVLFGVRSVADYRELDRYLPTIGFGRIHEEYQIVKVEKGKWVWRNKKPRGAQARGVDDYLGKYLEKSLEADLEDAIPESLREIEELGIDEGTPLLMSSFDEETRRRLKRALAPLKVALYFATNKRFFTCSRYPRPVPKGPRVVQWVFVGSFSLDELPDWLLDAVLDGLCGLPAELEDRLAGMLSLAFSYSESSLLRVVS